MASTHASIVRGVRVSVATMGVLAATRDVSAPTRRQVGKGKKSGDQGQVAKARDIVVSAVPTEVVGPYIALTAIIIGALRQPTRRNPDPEQLLGLRWGVLIGMVVLAGAAVWAAYSLKRDREADHPRTVPVWEIILAVLAAAIWSLTTPGSPLLAWMSESGIDKAYRASGRSGGCC